MLIWFVSLFVAGVFLLLISAVYLLFTGCYDGKVYFLERLTGRQHWTFQTGSQIKSSPCINATNGLVYIGSHDYHLYALSAEVNGHTILLL